MARNPLTEGKFVTVLQAIDTTGANPAATTISAVRQIRRVVAIEQWPSAGADPTLIARPSSSTDMLGNIVYIHSTNLAGTATIPPAGADDNFWVTVELGG